MQSSSRSSGRDRGARPHNRHEENAERFGQERSQSKIHKRPGDEDGDEERFDADAFLDNALFGGGAAHPSSSSRGDHAKDKKEEREQREAEEELQRLNDADDNEDDDDDHGDQRGSDDDLDLDLRDMDDVDNNDVPVDIDGGSEIKETSRQQYVYNQKGSHGMQRSGSIDNVETLTGDDEALNLSNKTFDMVSAVLTQQPIGGLRVLALQSCSLTHLPKLPSTIEQLDLSHNQLAVIRGLARLKNLQVLDLAFNKLTSISGLHKCMFIEQLSLANNQLKHTSGIEHLRLLRVLDLAGNHISSFDSVRSLSLNASLVQLFLEGNPIASKRTYNFKINNLLPSLEELDAQKVKVQRVKKTTKPSALAQTLQHSRSSGSSTKKRSGRHKKRQTTTESYEQQQQQQQQPFWDDTQQQQQQQQQPRKSPKKHRKPPQQSPPTLSRLATIDASACVEGFPLEFRRVYDNLGGRQRHYVTVDALRGVCADSGISAVLVDASLLNELLLQYASIHRQGKAALVLSDIKVFISKLALDMYQQRAVEGCNTLEDYVSHILLKLVDETRQQMENKQKKRRRAKSASARSRNKHLAKTTSMIQSSSSIPPEQEHQHHEQGRQNTAEQPHHSQARHEEYGEDGRSRYRGPRSKTHRSQRSMSLSAASSSSRHSGVPFVRQTSTSRRRAASVVRKPRKSPSQESIFDRLASRGTTASMSKRRDSVSNVSASNQRVYSKTPTAQRHPHSRKRSIISTTAPHTVPRTQMSRSVSMTSSTSRGRERQQRQIVSRMNSPPVMDSDEEENDEDGESVHRPRVTTRQISSVSATQRHNDDDYDDKDDDDDDGGGEDNKKMVGVNLEFDAGVAYTGNPVVQGKEKKGEDNKTVRRPVVGVGGKGGGSSWVDNIDVSSKEGIKTIVKNLNEKINKLYNWHLVEIDLVSKQQMQLNGLRQDLNATKAAVGLRPTPLSPSPAPNKDKQPRHRSQLSASSLSSALSVGDKDRKQEEEEDETVTRDSDILRLLKASLDMIVENGDPHSAEATTLRTLIAQQQKKEATMATASTPKTTATSNDAKDKKKKKKVMTVSPNVPAHVHTWLSAINDEMDSVRLSLENLLDLTAPPDAQATEGEIRAQREALEEFSQFLNECGVYNETHTPADVNAAIKTLSEDEIMHISMCKQRLQDLKQTLQHAVHMCVEEQPQSALVITLRKNLKRSVLLKPMSATDLPKRHEEQKTTTGAKDKDEIEDEAREKEAREKEAREKEAREKEAREKEAREKEAREKEAREKKAREQETREKETREKEAREKEARTKEAREKEAREKEAREKEAREKEAREKESSEKKAREKQQPKPKDEDILDELGIEFDDDLSFSEPDLP